MANLPNVLYMEWWINMWAAVAQKQVFWLIITHLILSEKRVWKE